MSCYGCQNNRADQLSHMVDGGCLYNDYTFIDIPPPSPIEKQVTDLFPVSQAIGCVVCVSHDYFGHTVGPVRRATCGMMRCQEHVSQCAYCYSPACSDNNLTCETCSYSGVASITQHFSGQSSNVCLYDRSVSPSEGWTCGCALCIKDMSAFYRSRFTFESDVEVVPNPDVIIDQIIIE